MIAVRTRKHVVLYSIVITAVAVATTGTFVHLATGHLHPRIHQFAMMLALGLPLVITPPISILSLFMMRFMTLGVDKIENFVKFDTLTGVLARSYFMESVRQRFGEGGAFMLADADNFKKVNDMYGHDVGDETLRLIGRVLNAAAPVEALIGRIGGEEFGIFIPGIAQMPAEVVARRICRAIREEGQVIATHPVKLTLSIGIAMIDPGSSLTLIYKEADESLYSAKMSGRDRYVVSRPIASIEPVPFRKTA